MTKEKKLSYFKNELNYIKEENLKKFLEVAIENMEDYVFTREASSTGKYHPLSDLGEGGLLRHIKTVFYLGVELLKLEHYQDIFTEHEQDLLLISLLLHDAKKYGDNEERKHTKVELSLLCGNWLASEIFEGIISEEDRQIICDCILAHSGQWNTNKKGEEILPKPIDKRTFFVHLCDYIASRRFLNVDLSVIDDTIKKAVEPKDFVITFGAKHKGETLETIYNKDKEYLFWAVNNMRIEPARTYIRKFMEEKNE